MSIVKEVTYFRSTHYYQSSFNTCGPTSLRMVMSSFWFFESEEYFKALCQTGRLWTESDHLSCAVDFLWGHSRMVINGSLKMVKDYLNLWYKVIVGYWYGRGIVGHYAVCKNIDSKHIYLDDPVHGPWHNYGKYYFEKEMWNLWNHKNGKNWFIAIKFWDSKKKKSQIERQEVKNESKRPIEVIPVRRSVTTSFFWWSQTSRFSISNSLLSPQDDYEEDTQFQDRKREIELEDEVFSRNWDDIDLYYLRLEQEEKKRQMNLKNTSENVFDQRFWDYWKR